VTLPNSYARGKTIYYQRAIPGDLQERCGATRVKVNLRTTDVRVAARKITAINREVEAEWARLRATPDVAPRSINAQALALLGQWGLAPGGSASEPAASLFYDALDSKRERFAAGDDVVHRDAAGSLYLTPVEVEAAILLAGTAEPRLTAALAKYLDVHPKGDQPRFRRYAERAFNRAVSVIGDKAIADVSRDDGRAFVNKLQKDALATGSIRRMLNTVQAVMATYIRENELTRSNPFARLSIKNEGADEDEAVPYTAAELATLIAAARRKDDDRRWLVAMIADTGARLSEIAGLALTDIKLDADIPHIIIQPHTWRSLKTDKSKRTVPLVANALWAAQRVKSIASQGQVFAFPRYTKTKTGTNGGSASATINAWIKGREVQLNHTVHELRHTMADRLRNVQCPADVRLAIGGWNRPGEGENYGDGYALRVKLDWLNKVAGK